MPGYPDDFAGLLPGEFSTRAEERLAEARDDLATLADDVSAIGVMLDKVFCAAQDRAEWITYEDARNPQVTREDRQQVAALRALAAALLARWENA